MSEFDGKTVVVTGAAGVLGRAVANAFHGAGANVIGLDIVEADVPWTLRTADLIDPDTAGAAFADLGDIDVLANIAGGFAMGDDIAGTSDETWDFMMNLNARTVLNCVRAVVPRMRAAGHGKIVNISARGALRGAAAMGAYIASKSVVQRLTETLADELKQDGINVNCILPSIIDTPQNRRDMPKAKFDRWVPPEDIAGVVVFLASEAARSIHGASVPVEALA